MKYKFISEEHDRISKLSNELKQKIKYSQRPTMSITALILGILIFISRILKLILEYNPVSFFFISIFIFGLAVYLIIAVLFILLWKDDTFYEIFKWIAFTVIYLIHFVWELFLIIAARDEGNEVRSLLILFFVTGIYFIFFRFNSIFICIICTMNLSLSIFFQVYNRDNYNRYYILELAMCIITPAACIVFRKHYDRVISMILSHITSNQNYMNYTEILLDQLPYFYFTFHKK